MVVDPAPSSASVGQRLWASVDFRALGSTCRIDVWSDVGGPDPSALADSATEFIDDLEARWTRFTPGSELARLNRHAGIAVPVSACTVDLVETAIAAWNRTAGAFDPSVGEALAAAGYDRTFDDVAVATLDRPPAGRCVVPGCAGIAIDRSGGTITLPPGTTLDLGGIGKGRAADLAAAHVIDRGAVGACVDLAGDLRLMGRAPEGGRWVIDVDDPDQPGETLATVAIADASGTGGAVATSSIMRRRWGPATAPAHHLIDPATGRPSTSGVVCATVVAADATWAEIIAKAAVIAGPDRGAALIADAGLAGLLVVRTGDTRDVRHAGDIEAFLVPPPPAPPDGIPAMGV